MKKIIITIMTLVLLMSSGIIKAEEAETVITKEKISLIDKGRVAFSNVEFSQLNYSSTGYVTLNMGSSTTYTMDLTNILQFTQYYESENVSNVYIQFDLQSVYTGISEENQRWLSESAEFESSTQKLKLTSGLVNSVSTELWWNVIGQSGSAPSTTTGGLRVYSINLVIEYTVPIDIFTNVSDWNQLPAGTRTLDSYVTDGFDLQKILETSDMRPVQLYDSADNKKNIIFNFPNNNYIAKGVTLPTAVTQKEITFAFYFATIDARFIVFLFDINQENIWDSDFLVWNLTNGEYNEAITNTVYGVASVRGDGWNTNNMVYVDIVIPWELDDIISVTMQYQYRYHYIVGGFGEFVEVKQQSLIKGRTTSTEMPWYRFYTQLVLNGLLDSLTEEAFERSEIINVTGDYDLAKKNDFTAKLNDYHQMSINQSDLFTPQAKVYELFLGQKNKTWSNAVEVKDIVVLNVRYMNNGIEYSSTLPDQLITGVKTKYPEKNWFDDFWDFVSNIYLIAAVIASILLTKIVVDILPKDLKNKKIVLAGIFVALMLLFYSFKL